MSDHTFTHRSADGLTITATLRLNPVHSAIVNLLRPYGIKEMVRTGTVATSRGAK